MLNEDFTGRNVIVTGASRGVGLVAASRLVEAGASVAAVAAHGKMLEDACNRLKRKFPGGNVYPVTADLRDDSALDEAIIQIRSILPDIDTIINNAGANPGLALEETTPDAVTEQVRLHVGAALRLIREFLPAMRSAKFGRIVNVSSAAAFLGSNSPSYAISKNALIGLTRSIARSAAIDNVTVNAVVPGPVDTDMAKMMSASRRAKFKNAIPAGRFARPEEIADPVMFLCTTNAGYINGACLHVNGGLYFGD